MPTMGKRLRQERKRLRLSQAELAAIGGVKANAQGHYELGIRLPRADYLASVYEVGVDVLYVVLGAKKQDPTQPLILRLNQNINAIASAVEEIGIWIDQRGSNDVYARVQRQLEVLHENSDFIAEAMADLIVRCAPEEDVDS